MPLLDAVFTMCVCVHVYIYRKLVVLYCMRAGIAYSNG